MSIQSLDETRHSGIRLTTKLATEEDTLAMMGSTFSVQSGKIYRQVFTGGEGAHATLELVNSSIGEAMGLAARFVPRFRERHEVEQVESATDHFYV